MLAVGALVLLVLALVPGLPSWPFLAIGAACAFGAFSAHARSDVLATQPSSLSSEALYLELGSTLYARLAPRDTLDGALSRALDGVLRELHDALGISLPRATPLASSTLASERAALAVARATGPAPRARAASELTTTIVVGLRTLARSRAAESLDLDEVSRRLDELAREQPALVSATVPHRLAPTLAGRGTATAGQRRRQRALARRNPGRHRAPCSARRRSRTHWSSAHAERLRAASVTRLRRADSCTCCVLSPELEETLTDCLRRVEHDDVLALPPSLSHEITSAIAAAHQNTPTPCALVTQAALRRHVRELLREHAPDLPVVSAYELMPHLSLSHG